MTERVIAGNARDGQLRLFEVDELPEWNGLDPDTCGYESGTYRDKSKCTLKGRLVYVNCREAGHCIWTPGDVPPENTEDGEE